MAEMMTVAERISAVLVEELRDAAQRAEFGVVVRDVKPLDYACLVEVAGPVAGRLNTIRLALVDQVEAVEAALGARSHKADVLTAREEVAVQWRNKQLRTIAVVTDRPLSKAASLRDFRPIGEADLIRRFCGQQADAAEVTWLRTLWNVLGRSPRLRITLPDLVRFADELAGAPPMERSVMAPRRLHLLGLLPDVRLADEKTDNRILRRLQLNRDFVDQLRRAINEDWSRVRAYCRKLEGTEKADANRLLRGLREATKDAQFEALDLEAAVSLWRAKAKVGSSGTEGGLPREPVERAVSRLLMDGKDTELADVAEEISQIAISALEDDAKVADQDVRRAGSDTKVSVVETNRDLLNLVRSRSTDSEWGGLIEVESDKPEALLQVAGFKEWTPFRIEPILKQLRAFAAEELVPTGLVTAVLRLAELRAVLLPHAAELAISPISVLAGRPVLLETLEQYIATYEDMLRLVSACYQDMTAAADLEAETVLSGLLALELYVYRRQDEIEAVMSPLHPLYLWRSVTIVHDVRGLAHTLSDREAQTVEEACADEIQLLQVLVLPQQVTGLDQSVMLGQAGTIGRLPIFRAAPRGVLEPDGVRTVPDIARRLAKLRPFARSGLQVVLVDPPRPGKFIEALLDELELEPEVNDDTYWGLHVRVRYTHEDTRGWANDVADLNETVREQLRRGEERGLVSLNVASEIMTPVDLTRELTAEPAHLAVIFDPFEVRSTPVARAGVHDLSPWMPTCEYRFNRIRKEIQVIPVAEEQVFGGYLAAAALLHTALQRRTPAYIPQVREVRDHLEAIAAQATWTVLADPHRVPLPRLGSAEVIALQLDGGRQLTTFAHDLSPFVGRLDQQLRRTHFQATTETLERLVRDLIALEPNGIIGLASSSHDKQVKGSLGKLIAMRWYRLQQPSGLSVSLDTPNAARWLVAGHHSKEKADLLGLREANGDLVVDVIEVKAHDEAPPYTVSDGVITGHAVGQVLATLQALAEVFTTEATSPLARPRREVLREHLYAALLKDQEPEYVERWHGLLEDAFSGRVAVRLSGRIVHVQLASVADTAGRTFVSASGIPIRVETLSAADVGLVLRSTSEAITIDSLPAAASQARGVQADPLSAPEMLRRLLAECPTTPELSELSEGDEVQATEDEANSVPEERPGPPDGVAPPTDRGAGLPSHPPAMTRQEAGGFLEVPLGTEYRSARPVRWAPGRQSNGFLLVLGASGSGKTETLKVVASAIHQFGVPVLTFDFHGDVVFPGTDSKLLSSGSASTIGLNPMEIDAHSAEESGLYDQRAALRAMIQRAAPSLQHRQSSILRGAFEEAYHRAGIVDEDTSTWTRPPPTFGDVQDILQEWAGDDARRSQRASIEGCLAAVQQLFDHPIFRRTNHVSVDEFLSHSVRLDLSKLPDDIRFVATETLLRKLFRVLRLRGPIPVQPANDRQRFRLFVLIDEAKILSLGGGDRDRSDNILNELVTEARKFGLGMILASQMSDHFSEDVRANAATWLVLKPMDMKEARRNAPNVSVEPQDLLQLAGRGDGYYRDRSAGRAQRIQVNSLLAVTYSAAG
ncbi:helicase HerA-like domain-containing protein [Rhodobacter sp. NSM]|uniref:helicase HerA-like domain-containing protein n=1 Tax=Rhodobacter sp. NSM TaxID=3457501 RepID=UPI003FD2E9B6